MTLAPPIRVPVLTALAFVGIIAAFAVAAEVATGDVSVSRRCGGPFTKEFSSAFDVAHCDYTFRKPSAGTKVTIRVY